MIKLVASDLDGTLLADDKSIPEANKKALERAKEAGIETGLCSGRALPGLKAVLNELGPQRLGRYHIGLNGGMLYDAQEDQVVEAHPIGEDCVRRVLALARERANRVNIQLYTREHAYVERRCTSTAVYERLNRCQLQEVPTLDVLAAKAVKIVLIFHEADQLRDYHQAKELQAELSHRLPAGTSCCCSCEYLCEIIRSDCNKGAGLRRLAQKLGIQEDEILAIGDNDNDRAMLETAGYPAAVANAAPAVQALCRSVSRRTNTEGGVAELINKIIFAEDE